MKSTTETFRVICKLLDGRINSADGLIYLDSILYHAWFEKYAPKVLTGEQSAIDAVRIGLPIRQFQNNRYAASTGFYKSYGESIEYWNKRPDWMAHESYYDLNNGSAKIRIGEGPMRAYRTPQVIRLVGDIEFYGYGTIDKIRDLLTYIPAVGKKPAAGWGAVAEWTVEEWPEDWSTWSEAYGLMRPIPIDEDIGHDLSGYVIRDCAIRPPSWKACNQTTCYIPRCEL